MTRASAPSVLRARAREGERATSGGKRGGARDDARADGVGRFDDAAAAPSGVAGGGRARLRPTRARSQILCAGSPSFVSRSPGSAADACAAAAAGAERPPPTARQRDARRATRRRARATAAAVPRPVSAAEQLSPPLGTCAPPATSRAGASSAAPRTRRATSSASSTRSAKKVARTARSRRGPASASPCRPRTAARAVVDHAARRADGLEPQKRRRTSTCVEACRVPRLGDGEEALLLMKAKKDGSRGARSRPRSRARRNEHVAAQRLRSPRLSRPLQECRDARGIARRPRRTDRGPAARPRAARAPSRFSRTRPSERARALRPRDLRFFIAPPTRSRCATVMRRASARGRRCAGCAAARPHRHSDSAIRGRATPRSRGGRPWGRRARARGVARPARVTAHSSCSRTCPTLGDGARRRKSMALELREWSHRCRARAAAAAAARDPRGARARQRHAAAEAAAPAVAPLPKLDAAAAAAAATARARARARASARGCHAPPGRDRGASVAADRRARRVQIECVAVADARASSYTPRLHRRASARTPRRTIVDKEPPLGRGRGRGARGAAAAVRRRRRRRRSRAAATSAKARVPRRPPTTRCATRGSCRRAARVSKSTANPTRAPSTAAMERALRARCAPRRERDHLQGGLMRSCGRLKADAGGIQWAHLARGSRDGDGARDARAPRQLARRSARGARSRALGRRDAGAAPRGARAARAPSATRRRAACASDRAARARAGALAAARARPYTPEAGRPIADAHACARLALPSAAICSRSRDRAPRRVGRPASRQRVSGRGRREAPPPVADGAERGAPIPVGAASRPSRRPRCARAPRHGARRSAAAPPRPSPRG